MVLNEPAGLNRVARLRGRSTPRASKTVDRPREEWTEIAVPALVSAQTFARVQQRLEDNKRFASRNSKLPSLLQSLAPARPAATAATAPPPAPRTRRSTTTGAWAATTTDTPAGGSAPTSRSGRPPRRRRVGPHHRAAGRPCVAPCRTGHTNGNGTARRDLGFRVGRPRLPPRRSVSSLGLGRRYVRAVVGAWWERRARNGLA
jgi:hypothetical protein